MNKIFLTASVLIVLVFSSCIKNDDVLYSSRIAEIDQTTWNANFANNDTALIYPILTRIPASGRVVGSAAPNGPDSTLRRYAGTIRVRINLVGQQATTDQTVGYSIFSLPAKIPTVSFPATLASQTPSASAAALSLANAVAGTHYTAPGGTVTIPANSSFGFIDIPILNSGTSSTTARFLGIQLNNTGSIPASTNYSQLGLAIDQR